jgi:leucine dehydrogenase
MFEDESMTAERLTTPVLATMDEMNHEEVLFCHDKATGLKAIIAVHNTVLGPALGGTRMWPYKNESEAITDVLRLSRGMTYKAAVAGLNLGGGKAVILGDARTQKTEALMRRFGQFVNDLGGKYITAEDVGMSAKDMELIGNHTKHVTGLPEHLGGSGNPSPVTAFGVFCGMKAAAKFAFGTDQLAGKKVAVQGCGSVGQSLIEHLVKEGAEVFVNDIFEDKIAETVNRFGVKAISSEELYNGAFDVYAPCALGATVNEETLSSMRVSVIAGAANNQLRNEETDSQLIKEKGIVYAPDFVINAGGLINVYAEFLGNYNRKNALEKTENIYSVIGQVLQNASANDSTTLQAAKDLAENRIKQMSALKLPYSAC